MTTDTLDTNLLASSRQQKAEPTQPTPIHRGKKAIKALSYVGIFLAAFFFFCYLKLPNSLVQSLVLSAVNQPGSGLQWQADSLSLGFFLSPHLTAKGLSTNGNFQIPPLKIDSLVVGPSLLSLPSLAFSFSGEAYQSKFSGSAAPKAQSFNVNWQDVNLEKLTPLRDQGIELQGIITSALVNMALTNGRLSQSDGEIKVTGKNFVIDPAALHIPMPLPIMDVGQVDIQGRLTRGKLSLTRAQLGSPGKDLQLLATGEIQLNDNINFSRADLRLKLKPSEKILGAMPALKQMLSTLAYLQPDGFYAMKTSGTFMQMNLPTPDKP